MKKVFSAGSNAERRPFLASECNSLAEAERWRLQIVRDLSRKVAQIQNFGLGEHKIRDLNDQINKLLREKGHWQHRIRQLGGPDYNALEPASLDAAGRPLPGGGGYKYFGAAKDLPGVKELFQEGPPPKKRRTRAEMYEHVTPDYYGFRDDELHPDLRAAEACADDQRRQAGVAREVSVRKERRDKGDARRQLLGEPSLDQDSSDDDLDMHEAMLKAVDNIAEKSKLQAAKPPQTAAATLLSVKKRDLLELIADSARHDHDDLGTDYQDPEIHEISGPRPQPQQHDDSVEQSLPSQPR